MNQGDYNFLWILHVLFALKIVEERKQENKSECLDMKDNPKVFASFV
jgi:hypothetical protein